MKYPDIRQIFEKVSAYGLKVQLTVPASKKPATRITHFSQLATAGKGALAWVSVPVFESFDMAAFKGTLLITPFSKKIKPGAQSAVLQTENPKLLFAKIVNDFFSASLEIKLPGLKDTPVSKDAVIAKGVRLAHGVVIGSGVRIGKNTVIGPNTVLCNCAIGENTVIGANCSIGFPGFGYVKDLDGAYIRFPHTGSVIIGNHVAIGSNTCIDRGGLGDTLISDGVKIDNLVHIAHNAHIGKNAIIIANSMIGGSAVIGDDAWIAPSASLLNKAVAGESSLIGMGAVVIRNVGKGEVVAGNPARVIRKKKKSCGGKQFQFAERLQKNISALPAYGR